jgi:hypothetical protein
MDIKLSDYGYVKTKILLVTGKCSKKTLTNN